MNTPRENEKPVEIKAKWADKSQEARVYYGSWLYGIGIVCVGILMFALMMVALHFDPVLLRKF